jgi:hypothetical protein
MGPRLMLSKAQKSAGAHTPHPAERYPQANVSYAEALVSMSGNSVS